MELQQLLKKDSLSNTELQEMLYRINNETSYDGNKIDLYNNAIHQASKLGIEELYKLYKDIEQYGISDEEKKLLQGNITFYIGELKNMSKENIQQMLYFINTERKNDENKIKLYNKAIFEASKFGISFLYKIYKEIEQYDITDEEKKLLQENVTFYMLKQEKVSAEDIQIMMYFMKTEKQNAEDKINILNQIIYMASTVGLDTLNKLYSELINQNLAEEEMKLLEGNIKFYASKIEEKTNNDNNISNVPKHK